MKKEHKIIYALICAFVLVTGSSCRRNLSSEQFNSEEQKYYVAYFTGDVHQAEIALLDGLKWASKCEEEYGRIPGIEIGACKAAFHERLFLIYEATHDTNKMESELRQSMECINQSRQSQDLPPFTENESVFARKLHNLDNGKNIRWRTNDFPMAELRR